MGIKEHISTDDAENTITEEENMAVWLLGIKTLRIQPYSLPPLGPYDVKIQIKAVGICGSDIHHFKNMRVANFVVKRPMVLGHECAGIVEQVGSQVKSLMIGDRVALEPGISCRQCYLCKDGRYNLCRQMKFFGSPPTNGALANQVVHPADLCFKLPDNVSLEEGAMCEPLSVGVHACCRAKDVEDEVGQICNAMGGPVDMSFDCVGFNKTLSMALQATHAGGKVCLVGLGQSEMTLPLSSAAAREVDVIGIFRYRNTWPLCIELLRTGKIDVKPLITHRYRFTQEGVEEAFETSSRGGNAIKVMFKL
nr:PREDICTED: L-idonate 5-dehydrogenase-like isoform X3 [Nicotiana tabacum]